MEARKSDFKKSPIPYDLRSKRRTANNDLRKDKRSQVVRRKRRTLSESADYELSASQVKMATEALQKDKQTHVSNLKLLRNAFAQGSALVDAFLQVDNSMECLVGLLTGTDSEVQLLAEWCLTNMAAGTEEHAEVVLKAAGSYLITFLSSPSAPLQDQSAWTLGNVACGEVECKQLVEWGVLPSLIPLLESACDKVLKSGVFALSNLARNDDAKKQMVELGVVEKLMVVLGGSHADDLEILTECAWLLTYLAACKESCGKMVQLGALEKLVGIFIHHSHTTPLNVQLLTPVGRCIGNLFCETDEEIVIRSLNATSSLSPPPTSSSALSSMDTTECIPEAGDGLGAGSSSSSGGGDSSSGGGFLGGVNKLLTSTVVHLNKEALWVLSNMAVFQGQTEEMMRTGLHKSVISLLSSVYSVSYEAVCCLGNMSVHGEEVCTKLYQDGCIQQLIPLLSSHELAIVQASLYLVQALLLVNGEKGAQTFEEHRGLTALELLEYHPNQAISQLTNEILEKCIYIYQDK